MPNERVMLEALNRRDLLDLVNHFKLEVSDKRIREHLIEGLLANKEIDFAQILAKLPVAALKDICQQHTIDDSGRLKAQLVERIVQAVSKASKPKPSAKKSKAEPAPQPAPQKVKAPLVVGDDSCKACAQSIILRKCQVQNCNNIIVVTQTRKICPECLFERNTLSMTDFNERLAEEALCPHCGKHWERAS